ncbi:hypothetical protein GIB67_030786 [Kingdonia uniflora]|uniref:Uncharacterized protein n=1 Tax=Kingdonia uniflora TaxID=39325 RepID=A0A7J7L373_9MAGN|nr:hypothetical protein GIB67_030786 [Kingdonia uniflora]
MLHNHGNMLGRILMSTVGDCTLPLGNTPLLGQYQLSTPEKTMKRKGEEAKNLLQQDTPGEIFEVVNDLMVDDDVEVGREVNFNERLFEYTGDHLEKKGDKKDNDDKKDVEEKDKSEDEQPQVAEEEEVQEYVYPILQMEESKNGNEKVDDAEKDGEEIEFEEEQPQVTEEEDSEQPTVVVYCTGKNNTMVAVEVAKTDIVFFNQEEVVGEAYQASADETTVAFVEEQTLEAEKTEDETSQASTDQKTVVSVEEQTIEFAQTEVVISHQEEDVSEACQVINVYIKALIQYFDTQHRARPDKEGIVLADIFARQYIGCAFNV